MEYIPDTAKYVSGAVYANTVIIKRQNSETLLLTAKKINKIMAMYRINVHERAATFKTPEHRGSAWFWRGAERQEGGYM
jgi:hypothetical protein